MLKLSICLTDVHLDVFAVDSCERPATASLCDKCDQGSERATGSGHHQPEQFVLRALCPQCEELLEWAPSFYGAARSAVGMTLGELKTRCAERTEELRHELASERRRLRQYVGEEVDVLLEVGVRTESSRNAAPACTESAQQQQRPWQRAVCAVSSVEDVAEGSL